MLLNEIKFGIYILVVYYEIENIYVLNQQY